MSEHETRLAAAIEEFFAAMIAEGYTKEQAALRAHQLVTYALVSFQREARVQARRKALHIIVGAVKPGEAQS
jgi:hypothetical protein